MGTKRQEAQEIYKETYCQIFNANKEELSRKKIVYLIHQFLTIVDPGDRFRFKEFPAIMELNWLGGNFRPDKAKRVFERIEMYLIQVVKCPWKTEFYSIREYCGFYQTRVESNLKGCKAIFGLAGYNTSEDGIFLLSSVEIRRIIEVAFECLVASVECGILLSIHGSLKKQKIEPERIVRCRFTNSGDANQIVSILHQETNVTYDNASKEKGSVLNQPSGTKLQRCAGALDQNADGRLERNRELYFPSKIDQFQNSISSKISLENSRGIIDPSAPMPYIGSQGQSKMLEEKTHDEHLQDSLQYINSEYNIGVKGFPSGTIKEPSEDWSFVRRKLEKDYGREYYAGTRGDFLKDSRMSQIDEGIGTASDIPISSNYPRTADESVSVEVRPKYRTNSELKGKIYNQLIYSGDTWNTGYPGEIRYPPSKPLLARSGSFEAHASTIDNKKDQFRFDGNDEILFSERPLANTGVTLRASNSFKTEKRSPSNSAPQATKKHLDSSERHSRPQSVSAEIKLWYCAHCTMGNPLYESVCMACSKSRDCTDGKISPVAKNFSRVCGTCTLENKADAEFCQACQTRLVKTFSTV